MYSDSRCASARLDREGEHRKTGDDENRGGGVHRTVWTVRSSTVRCDKRSRRSTQALEATCESVSGAAVRSRELFRQVRSWFLTARTVKWTHSFRSDGIYDAVAVA